MFLIGFYVTLTHALHHLWFCSQLPFPRDQVVCSSGKALENPISSVSTVSSTGESSAHNVWNPVLELLFHGQISGAFEPFLVETVPALFPARSFCTLPCCTSSRAMESPTVKLIH